MAQKHIFIALTGASGSMYGLRLTEQLCLNDFQVTFTASCSGTAVCREETGLDLSGDLDKALQRLYAHLEINSGITLVHPDDLFCGAASGSSAPDAMVICPCSMGTLARVAGGVSGNLIERSADVMLKERRPLLLVPRETPLSDIHLENMLRRCPHSTAGRIQFWTWLILSSGKYWISSGSRTTSTSGGVRNNPEPANSDAKKTIFY